jgi:hypothetical protein
LQADTWELNQKLPDETMNTLKMDFTDITAGLFVLFLGLIAILISLFRLKSKDFSLLNFGLLCFIDGIRWLVEIPSMKTLVGFPFTFPYFHGLLTYALVIPFSAFLVYIFGRGLYDSLLWTFRSTIVYAAAAIAYDLITHRFLTDVSIYPPLVVVWGIVWIVNILMIRKQHDIELRVLRIAFIITLASVTIDNLISRGAIPWGVSLEHTSFLVLCAGLGFVAVHHFFSNEKKLSAIEQEIEIARQIQQSNLPSTLCPPNGINIASRYVPMTEVAGDFYDYHMNDETSIGIFMADVSGHGVGAALIGSMLKIAFASQSENISDPALVLTEINRILQGKIEGSFVTACSVFIDAVNKKIKFASAGHPQQVLWRGRNNEICRLPIGGTILGPFPDSAYKNAEMNIETGDRLVLFTDGVVEAMNKAGDFFGDERLEEFIKQHSPDSANVIVDQFITHLSKWSGRPGNSSFDDDLTLIIIDVTGDAGKEKA